MSLGNFLLENFAGDLEYHPRRAAIYLCLAAAAGCYWFFLPHDAKFTPTALVCALGSLTLLLKGVFLLRRSSEGIGLSEQDKTALSHASNRKELPKLPHEVAQIVQDFGAGGMLFWPVLRYSTGLDEPSLGLPSLRVFIMGAFLFFLGWLVRRSTAEAQ